MKRLLVFLVLFGCGLLALRWVEGPTSAREVPPDLPSQPLERPTVEPPADESPLGLSIGGRFETTLFDPATGRATLRFESLDSRTVNERDEFYGVQARVVDPKADSFAPQATIRSERATMRRIGQGESYQPEFENRIELEGVEAEIHEASGSPLAPMDLETESASVDARDAGSRILESPDEVAITSEQLNAAGVGLSLHFDEGLLAFERDGRIEFLDQGVARAALTSAGATRILKRLEPSPSLTIEAEDDARLEFFGEQAWVLAADRIRIRGFLGESGEEDLRIERVDATGKVTWTKGEELTFEGGRAAVSFDEAGNPLSARLSELPVARILVPAEASPLPDSEAQGVQPLRLSGRGPLDVTWSSGSRFEMSGPATAESQNATLRSLGPIEGWSQGPTSAGFSAAGGVVLESGTTLLETASVDWSFAQDAEGRNLQTARAEGGPRLAGELSDGRRFTVTSPTHMAVRARQDEWRVVDAKDVVLSIEGDEGFRARAEEITLFDPTYMDLEAEGSVSFEGELGDGKAQRLSLKNGADLALFGGDGQLAELRSGEMEVRAQEIEGEEGSFSARRDVWARLSPAHGESSYEIDCDALDARGSRGPEPERTRLEARGDVDARIAAASDNSRIQCLELDIDMDGSPQDEQSVGSSRLNARGEVRATLEREDSRLFVESDEMFLNRVSTDLEPQAYDARAQGRVQFALDVTDEAPWHVEGRGEEFFLDAQRRGRLMPAPGERAQIQGERGAEGHPFEVEGDEFRFLGEGQLEVVEPLVRIERMLPPGEEPVTDRTEGVEATGRQLILSEGVFEMIDGVRIRSVTDSGVPWLLSCGSVRFEGRAGDESSAPELSGLHAAGGVDFLLGSRGIPVEEQHVARATGDELLSESLFGELRLVGRPARIESPAFISEASWIAFDPDLQIVVATGHGQLLPVDSGPPQKEEAKTQVEGSGTNGQADEAREEQPEVPGWSLSYLSSKTLVEPDSLIYILQEPVFEDPANQGSLRASWAVFWIDRHKWMDVPGRVASGEHEAERLKAFAQKAGEREPENAYQARLFGFLEGFGFEGLLRESYFEGPVEVLRQGDLLARADAIYLDPIQGHGWLANATVNVWGRLVGQDFEKLICKTDWLRHSKDGSLRANSATVTPCDFEDPHMRIVTGDLRITPLKADEYEVELKNNRIELYDLFTLPLPTFAVSTNEKGKPLWESLKFGDSARFGSFVSAGVRRPAGGLGEKVNDVLGGDPVNYDAEYSIDASWLGSRGILLDLGLSLESKEDYWLQMNLGGLPDDGDDRGYIRVNDLPIGVDPIRPSPANPTPPPLVLLDDNGNPHEVEGRDNLRLWYRARGRYVLGDDHWINLRAAFQTDPGVQSEFWEREFERYEENQTFVQWRRAKDGHYYDASAKTRLNDFQSEIEELPSVGAFTGREPWFQLASVPVLHSSNSRAEYLRRREGELALASPFGLPSRFPDGLGEREVLRFDSEQRLEAPISLGVAGAKAIPFIDARFSAWDEGIDRQDSPTRLFVAAGLRLATTFWKETARGTVHQLAPYVEVRADVAQEDHGGDPVPFDRVENDIDGDVIDVGLRGRIHVDREGQSLIDFLVNGTRVNDRDDAPDEWLPIGVYARMDLEAWDTPVQLFHDARYNGETVYSWTRAAVRFNDRFRIEGAHRRGTALTERFLEDPGSPNTFRFAQGPELFEAASIAGLLRWTEKWEFEGRQTVSLASDSRLDTRLIVRRFGHDIIFETELSVREGEGTSLGFTVRPFFGYNPSRLGYLNL